MFGSSLKSLLDTASCSCKKVRPKATCCEGSFYDMMDGVSALLGVIDRMGGTSTTDRSKSSSSEFEVEIQTRPSLMLRS